MSSESLLLIPIVAPFLVAAFGVPLLRRSPRGAALASLLTVLVSAAALAACAGSGARIVQSWVGPISLDFSVTAWKTLLLAFVLCFQVMTGVYLLRGIEQVARPTLFLLGLLAATGSAAAVILTDNLLVLLVFWEVFLVALYAVIQSSGEHAERVAMKALVIGGASDFLMILGLMLYLGIGGAPDGSVALSTATSRGPLIAFVLIFLGAGAKAGMFPFHTWIPEAAEVMPAPGFAALPASMEKILGISFLWVVCNRMFVLDHRARLIMVAFALATVFVVLVPALVERDLRRVLALTAISPVGFMVVGMATSAAAGAAGALLYMLTHATYKSAMFLGVGAFEGRAGSSKLEDLQGIGRVMPVSAVGFVLAFLAAISLPPTGGFMAKELIFEGLLEHGGLPVLALLWLGALLNVAVFCKVVAVLYARRTPGQRLEAPAVQSVPVLLLGLGAFATGLVFTAVSGVLGHLVGAEDAHFLNAVWHLSPLTVASLGIWALGLVTYLKARERAASPATAFESLWSSPVLGRGLELAAAKKLDLYEIGLKVVELVTRVVFRHVERLIDVVADGVIGIGCGLSRHFLAAVHNGVYGTYLGWALLGLLVVLSLVFTR